MRRLSILLKFLMLFLLIVSTSSVTFANKTHCKKYNKQHSSYAYVKKKKFKQMAMNSSRSKPACKRKVVYVKPAPVKKTPCVKKMAYKPCKVKRRPCYKDAIFKDQPCCKGLCDGFYVGIAGGVDSYRLRQERTGGIDGIIVVTSNPALNATGLVSALYAGYGKYFNNFYYAGAEIFGNISGASTNYTLTGDEFGGNLLTLRTRVSADRVFGIALLPGLKVNDDTLLYLRLGYSRAGFRTNEFTEVALLASGAGSRRNWVNGIAYGIGLETLIYQNLSIRGEYTHTEYQSFNAPDYIMPTTEGPGINEVGTGGTYFPSNNQYTLGLTYHFS